jgi:hypothetical protein
VNATVNAGLVIENPNSQPANISFSLTDVNGGNSGPGDVVIPAGGQIAAFLDQSPFKLNRSALGTFTFSSDLPIAVAALRGLTNKCSEFLMTALSVVGLTKSTSETIVVPQFADCGGWTTEIMLVNRRNDFGLCSVY